MYKGEEKNANVTLIESHNILNSFDERLRRYAETKMRQRERFHLVQAAVTGQCSCSLLSRSLVANESSIRRMLYGQIVEQANGMVLL